MEHLSRKTPISSITELPASAWKRISKGVNPPLEGILIANQVNISIIISKQGYWCFLTKSNLLNTAEDNNLMPLLPFLEVGCEIFNEALLDGLSAQGLPSNIVDTFPFDYIMSTAIRVKSDYWTSLAISWLHCYEINSLIKSILQEVMTATWASQQTKHLAKKTYFKKAKSST